jgi:regulator of replication initiation timing
MAKKKVKSLTSEELTKVQNYVSAVNQTQMQIGGLEAQKYEAIQQMNLLRAELQKVQEELQEKYGNVSINLADGTLTENADNSQN